MNMSEFMNKVFLTGILVIAAFFLFYRLSDLMVFIGDQGWFYLSARDMLLTGKIPLVGITASHTWLHQGALWTYVLAIALWISHFNPVSGAYLTAGLGLITVWLVYKVGSEMFSTRVGLLAALFYATSPLIIFQARMAYHLSPIPFLTVLLLYAVYKWIRGSPYGLPIIFFLLGLLYNFELSNFTLVLLVLLLLLYGLWKKTSWAKTLFNKKILLLTITAGIIPMLPMIIYDTNHGYPQTFKFMLWIGYKVATVFGFPKVHPDAPAETYQTMLPYASMLVRQIFFLGNQIVSWLVLFASSLCVFYVTYIHIHKRNFLHAYSLLILFLIIPVLGYIVSKTNSESYVVVLFPIFALMIGILVDFLMTIRLMKWISLIVFLALITSNGYLLYTSNFLMGKYGYGPTMQQRLQVAKQIVTVAHGRKYNLIGRGPGSKFASFTMNTAYLTWWLGNGPSANPQRLKFTVAETSEKISVRVWNQ